jgi:phosphoglycolate phosphatase
VRHLLWDIDGTLLSTGRAGVFALEDAALDVCGERIELQAMKTAGMTDSEIAAAVIESHRGSPAQRDELARFLDVYERELPARLGLRRGQVLPGVRAVLERLAGRSDVRSLLLTGNTERGAAAKLEHYGLGEFFSGGAFCRPGDDRVTIARRAATLLEPADPGAALVIGDTPNDVACADAIGVRTLAVATGGYSADELRACGAWRVVERLPDPDAFLELAGLDAQAAPA